jgi:hypothetical protein
MSTSFGKRLRVLTIGLSISALAILIAPVNRAFGGTVYNAVSDFSATANPNGVWSYGWSATLGGPLNLYTNSDSTCYTGVSGWSELATGITCLPPPALLHNNTNQLIHLFPTVVLPPTVLLLHPGTAGEYSVLQWTAPTSGRFQIFAYFTGLDSAGPTTTDVHVLAFSPKTQSTTTLYSGHITSFLLPSTINFPPTHFSAGDTVSFAVGFGADGNYNSDSTGVAARIWPR